MSDIIDQLNSVLSDRHLIERELGQGGMATVYLAEDLKHKRKVAVKVLKPELTATLGAQRFLKEIDAIVLSIILLVGVSFISSPLELFA